MARRTEPEGKAPPGGAEPDPPPPQPRRKKAQKAAKTIAQVAGAIRHRDEILAEVLGMLVGAGLIDGRTRDHVWGVYERGDARTQALIQRLVARVVRVPGDDLSQAADLDALDPDAVSERALEVLSRIPEVDTGRIGDRVRGVDVDDLLVRAERKSRLFQALTHVPVVAYRVRRQLFLVGGLLLVVVAVALLFPRYAQEIAFYGLLGALALLGGLLIKWAWQMGRFARRHDLDLAALARLSPEDRGLILARRLLGQFVDAGRMGDLVERGLNAVVPDAFQAKRGAGGAHQKRPAKRMLPLEDADGDAEDGERGDSGGR